MERLGCVGSTVFWQPWFLTYDWIITLWHLIQSRVFTAVMHKYWRASTCSCGLGNSANVFLSSFT